MRIIKLKILVFLIILFFEAFSLQAGENKIIGFLQGQFINDQTENSIHSGFNIHRARLGIKGFLERDFTYNVIFGAVEPPDSNPQLVNAFINYNHASHLKVRFGQFLLPFGLEGRQPITVNPAIERTTAIKKLNPFSMFRDIGLQISGNHKLIDYAIAVINGTGANSSDDNNFKDVLGRIALVPWDNLEIGISSHFGKYTSGAKKKLNRKRYALDIEFIQGKLRLRSEIQNRHDEQLDSTKVITAGGYFLSTYNLTPQLEPIVKYELYYPNADKLDNKTDIVTLGFNYYIQKNNKISINYEFKNDIENPNTGNLFTTQFQIVF